MLKSLTKLRPSERRRLLSRALDVVLSLPRGEEAVSLPKDVDVDVRQLLSEAGASETTKLGERELTAVVKTLRSELERELLPQDARKAVSRRLAQSGNLVWGSYTVKLPENFDDVLGRRGITRQEVRAAASDPDSIQHLAAVPGFEPYSVLVQVKAGRDPYALWILADRTSEVVMQVHDVWRIYFKDIDSSRVGSPMELLEAFLRVFGKTLQIVGRTSARFVEYEAVPSHVIGLGRVNEYLRTGDPRPLFEIKDGRQREEIYIVSRIRVSEQDVVQFHLFYAVSLTDYLGALRRHGQPVKVEQE